MKLIVGLGNPGIEYQFTPHNIGFLVLDRLAAECRVEIRNRQCQALTARGQIAGEAVLLAKPETYMNLSGMAVRELVRKHEIEPEKDLLVIYDELDLPLGALRIRHRGTSAGHNGMESVLGALGTNEIQRLRLGIAPDHPLTDGARYVLAPFRRAQEKVVADVIEAAAQAVAVILQDGLAAAMNRFNRRPEKSEE